MHCSENHSILTSWLLRYDSQEIVISKIIKMRQVSSFYSGACHNDYNVIEEGTHRGQNLHS